MHKKLTASMRSQSPQPCWWSRVAAPSPVGPAPTTRTPTCLFFQYGRKKKRTEGKKVSFFVCFGRFSVSLFRRATRAGFVCFHRDAAIDRFARGKNSRSLFLSFFSTILAFSGKSEALGVLCGAMTPRYESECERRRDNKCKGEGEREREKKSC